MKIKEWVIKHPVWSVVIVIFVGLCFVPLPVQTPAAAVPSANSSAPSASLAKQVQAASNQPQLPSHKPGAVSVTKAIQNYSEATASNVDVVGIITSMLPVRPDSITAPFGNTLIVSDGNYSVAVHQVSSADFQNVAAGDMVEITGGYMQQPSNNAPSGGWTAPIVDLGGSVPISVRAISVENLPQ